MNEETASLFIAHSVKKLRQMSDHIDSCLTKLTEDQVWSRGAAHENAIGNLILHLCGNARQWIGAGVGREQDTRNRDGVFDTKGGLSIADLKSHLHQTVEHAISIISSVSPDRLAEEIRPQDQTVSVLEAIYQVVGHFQQHTGQIIFATKILSGEDLVLYRTPWQPKEAPVQR